MFLGLLKVEPDLLDVSAILTPTQALDGHCLVAETEVGIGVGQRCRRDVIHVIDDMETWSVIRGSVIGNVAKLAVFARAQREQRM